MPDLSLERDEAEALLVAVREAIIDAAVDAASHGDGRTLNALMRAEAKLADYVEAYGGSDLPMKSSRLPRYRVP